MPFDIEGARNAGYSDQEIADHLSGGKFDTEGARKAGYSDADIIGHLSAPPPAEKEIPGQISIPGIGKPSLVGMVKGLLEAGKSAVTAPREAMEGKFDPVSDEGIKRSMDIAGFVAPSRFQSVATRGAAKAPLTSKALQDTAGESYDAIKGGARNIPIEAGATAPFAKELAEYTAKNAPSEMRTPGTYAEIGKIGQAKDVRQLIEVRQNLRDLQRAGGEEGKAAGVAMNRLDFEIERRAPGTVSPLKTTDKDYAISKRAQEVEQLRKDAQTKSETSGAEGAHIRTAFRNEMLDGGDRFMSPGVKDAFNSVVRPGGGARFLGQAARFDPSTRPFMGWGSALFSGGASAAIGTPARMLHDQIMRSRSKDAVRAILEEAPSSGSMSRQRIGMRPSGGYLTQPSVPLLSDLLQSEKYQ